MKITGKGLRHNTSVDGNILDGSNLNLLVVDKYYTSFSSEVLIDLYEKSRTKENDEAMRKGFEAYLGVSRKQGNVTIMKYIYDKVKGMILNPKY